MRKFFVGSVMLLVAVMSGMAALASPVGAARVRDGQLTFPFSGTSTFDFSTPPCSFVHQVFDATANVGREPATLHLDGCVRISSLPSPFAFDGSFTITVAHRGQVTGSATGTIGDDSSVSCASGQVGSSLEFGLAPTGGTRSLRHTITSIEVAGSWCSPALPDQPGPISGTVTVLLAHDHHSL